MTDLRGHNLDAFAQQSAAEMARWLEAALLRYVRSGGETASFSPLDTDLARADTTESGLAQVLAPLEPGALVRFREALSEVTAIWPADLRSGWLVLVELCWRLEAVPAIETLAARASDAFLEMLFGDGDEDQFAIILECCRETIPFDRPVASAFLHRLVEHGLFDDSEAALTLASLCERDAENWVLHMAVLRGALDAQARRIERTKGAERRIEFHDSLAEQIVSCVGLDRLAAGLRGRGLRSTNNASEPSDNWLIDQIPFLFEVELSDVGLGIAPKSHRSNFRFIRRGEMSVPVVAYWVGALSNPDYALGTVSVPRLEMPF